MADEFDEGFPEGLSELRMWRYDVHGRENGEADADTDDLQGLEHHILPTETG
jgi:hypothetical protein